MHSFKALLVLLLALWCAPAAAWTPTANGTKNCNSAANSCALTVTSTVATGSATLLVATLSSNSISSAPTVSDSAGNCSGYTVQYVSNAKGTVVVAWCAATTTSLSGGSSTITVTYSGATQKFSMAAFTVSGFNTATPFHTQGTDVAATWTSGTPISASASPALLYTPEYALVVVGVSSAPGTTDSLGSVTGGYASVGTSGGGAQFSPEQFIFGQTISTGTATFGATPTASAAGSYNAQVFMFPSAGAVIAAKPTRTLLGVGQ